MVEVKSTHPGGVVRNHPEIYPLLIDAVTDFGIFALDREGRILSWNAGAERLTGFGPAEVLGTHFSRFYEAADITRQHPEFELERARADGRYEEEAWRLRKDGSRYWAKVSIIRLCDREGHHVGFTKLVRDLTERRLAEQKLRASEERLRAMIDSVSDHAIIMLDRYGTVQTWNNGARQITGYAAEEIIGRPLASFYLRDEAQTGRPGRDLAEAREYGRVEAEGWRVRSDGDRFWAQATVTPLYGDAGSPLGYSLVIRDLTERVRSESRVRAAHEDLERRIEARTAELARAVTARDEFVSLASHELKTPLTSLKLSAQMRLRMLERGQLDRFTPERLREMMSGDETQIRRLARLVDDMLELSRLNLGKFAIRRETCDLGALLRNLVARLVETHPRSQFAINLAGPVEGAWDAFRLEQIFTNLITNAVRYGGGSPIEVSGGVGDGGAWVNVRDEGPGITAVDQSRIFLPFERAVSIDDQGGLGLGLFISRRIAEAHGGSLTLESAPGRGAVFTVRLPRGEAP